MSIKSFVLVDVYSIICYGFCMLINQKQLTYGGNIMYYAGYNYINTDIAIFTTKKDRDKWVKDESFLERIPFSSRDVIALVGRKAERQSDIIDENLIWLINKLNK